MTLLRGARGPMMAAMIAVGAAAPVAAQTLLTYDFGVRATGSGPASGSFASLSVTTSDYLSFTYHLAISSGLNELFGSAGTFVSNLRVNTASNADPVSVSIMPGTWGVSEVRLNPNPNNAIGVEWDFTNGFCGAGAACNPSGASSRLTQGEEVMWNVTFAEPQVPPFGQPPFLLKVQGYGASAAYTPVSPIPEPRTYAMLLAGLAFLTFALHRRSLQRSVWRA